MKVWDIDKVQTFKTLRILLFSFVFSETVRRNLLKEE